MAQDLQQLQESLEETEEKIAQTIRNISDLDNKMNQPEYTHSDIEIFIMNKKMEQDSLKEYMAEKKKLLIEIRKAQP